MKRKPSKTKAAKKKTTPTFTPADNDLIDFMRAATSKITEEYIRIRKRATNDPGTAGDEGEENWKALLQDWLPAHYHVRTKGKILFPNGNASPQVDVLVLKPSYPKKLLDTKMYLAGGVAAAFECKLTLTAAHIKNAVETSAFIRENLPPRLGSPYREIQSPIIYGLLTHSHSWKGAASRPIENIEVNLSEAVEQFTTHPRKGLDLICVADLATWFYSKSICTLSGLLSPMKPSLNRPDTREEKIKNLGPSTGYARNSEELQSNGSGFSTIGAVILHLLRKLAWEDPTLRSVADYFNMVELAGGSAGLAKQWDFSIYSDSVIDQLFADKYVENQNQPWDEWSRLFF